MTTWLYLNTVLILLYVVNKHLIYGLVFTMSDRVFISMSRWGSLSKAKNAYLLFSGLLRIAAWLSVISYLLVYLYKL